MTRGWLVPGGFEASDKKLPISVYFTQPDHNDGYIEEFFYYDNNKWKVSKLDLAATTYYLYGYIPHDKSIMSSVAVLPGDDKNFSHGAVLTLSGVPTVSKADVCVAVGVKNGSADYRAEGDYSVTGLTRGDFAYAAQPAEGGTGNYVYMLFDHLFSALRIRMRVQGDYAALRTIKLKELHLQTKDDGVATKNLTDIAITLTKTSEGADPISNIVFTPTGSDNSGGAVFGPDAGIALTTDYQSFQGHFMPEGVNTLVLTSTYDVYDNNEPSNLICQRKAVNTIELSKLFSGQTEALRGHCYTVKMTINPTYLYMLSEPDLDNPSVVVE